MISDDGAWVLYNLTVRIGDAELVVRHPGGAEHRVDRATDARFSPDSRFAVFTIEPAHDSARVLELAETSPEDMRDTLGILDLVGGAVVRIADLRSWKLPTESGSILAYLVDPGEPETEPAETEAEEEPAEEEEEEERERPDTYPLVVRDLGSGAEQRYENVVDYAVSEDGARVAYAASSEDGHADGVFVVTPGLEDAVPVLRLEHPDAAVLRPLPQGRPGARLAGGRGPPRRGRRRASSSWSERTRAPIAEPRVASGERMSRSRSPVSRYPGCRACSTSATRLVRVAGSNGFGRKSYSPRRIPSRTTSSAV